MRLLYTVSLLSFTNFLIGQWVGGDYNPGDISTIASDSLAVEGDIYRNLSTNDYFLGTSSGHLISLNSNSWLLSGNTIDANANFLGSINNEPLIFRTNNIERITIGEESGGNFTLFAGSFQPDYTLSGNVTGFSQSIDLQNNSETNNLQGIENMLYGRSGSNINNRMRGIRNRLWNIFTEDYSDVVGVWNEYRGEGTDIDNYIGYDNDVDLRAGGDISEASILRNTFNLINGNIDEFKGINFESYTGNRIDDYYGFYQGNLGTASNRYVLYYEGDDINTKDVVVTGTGQVGIGIDAPSAALEIDAGIADQSGLKFSQLNNSSNVDNTAHPIGVNASGEVALTGTAVYVGHFIINTTGTQTITGLPFEPSSVTFTAQANIDATNINDDNSTGSNNTNTLENAFGTMTGYARNDGASIEQLVTYVGGHGNSINDISRYANNNQCIGIRYSNQNGDNLGLTTAELTTFNTDGFTLNVTNKTDDLLIIYTAYR